MSLHFVERPAAGDPAGLLILHHGRGSDEHDLLGLADVLDPERRRHVVSPRAPLTLPGAPGHHWYVVPRVGYPDRVTFEAGRHALAEFHDETWARTGISAADTVLGGFSQGAVMSLALGLSAERPVPAGILAFSGFVPTVAGWAPDLAGRAGLPVLIAHGHRDPVIGVDFAHRADALLAAGGLTTTFLEGGGGHQIEPAHAAAAARWLADRTGARTRNRARTGATSTP
jgi:phospholipase/carboxylesterase